VVYFVEVSVGFAENLKEQFALDFEAQPFSKA